jgi:hypothetical protein
MTMEPLSASENVDSSANMMPMEPVDPVSIISPWKIGVPSAAETLAPSAWVMNTVP